MNGRVMPLAGMSWMVEAMLMAACRPNCTPSAGGRQGDEQAGLLRGARQRAQGHEGEQAEDHQADDQAEFLAGDGHDEIGVRVGQLRLHRALARAAAEQRSRS